jgi:hypothetical protein
LLALLRPLLLLGLLPLLLLLRLLYLLLSLRRQLTGVTTVSLPRL